MKGWLYEVTTSFKAVKCREYATDVNKKPCLWVDRVEYFHSLHLFGSAVLFMTEETICILFV